MADAREAINDARHSTMKYFTWRRRFAQFYKTLEIPTTTVLEGHLTI